ncbi:hypothetical protein Taro_055068, partial [Colocasia esculenta]|nr:hypothetical protein [Colocasia esculenta]
TQDDKTWLRFTLCYGAPPSPSYHGSFHQ